MAVKRNSLAIIHAAITDPVARSVLGALNHDDLQFLADHAAARTLATALQPLAADTRREDALIAMPGTLGNLVRKLPDEAIVGLRGNLSALQTEAGGPVPCKCK